MRSRFNATPGRRATQAQSAGDVPAAIHRLVWVDVAKGAAIVLVLVHHAVQRLSIESLSPQWMITVDSFFVVVRMPLFFLAAGLFAGRTLSGPWRVVLRKRVAFYAWLYALWVSLTMIVLDFPFAGTSDDRVEFLGVWATSLVLPYGALWFLWALAIFSIGVKLLWRIRLAVQLSLAMMLALAVGADLIDSNSTALWSMAAYFVFFLLGVRLPDIARAVAARGRPATAVPAAAVLAVLGLCWYRFALGVVPVIPVGVSMLAVIACILISSAVATGPLGRGLAHLGSRTLPLYLVHPIVVATCVKVFVLAGAQLEIAPFLLLLVVTVCVALGLAAPAMATAVRAGWLFSLPTRWAYRPAPATSGR